MPRRPETFNRQNTGIKTPASKRWRPAQLSVSKSRNMKETW
jgi:hypothetical protein